MAEKINSKSSFEWISMGMTLVVLFASAADAQVSTESSEVHSKKMFYVCPPEFVRLGQSCYYFSKDAASWQDAHFACKDRESHLTAPERWEDKNLREYLNSSGIEKRNRWIGGTYDHEDHAWKWGGEMRQMNYQSFAKMRRLKPDQLKWHCIAMIPEIAYRWDPISCIEKNYYICQVKIRKVHKPERNRLRQKWNPDGNGHKPNEIQVPSATTNDLYNKQEDNEIRPDFRNRIDLDSNAIPLPPTNYKNRNNNRNRTGLNVNNNRKFYIPGNLRKRPNITDNNAFSYRPNNKKVSNRPNMKRTKPFRGFKENKEDPESAYKHNIKALKSGRTGLSEAQVEKHLKRLERMRKKEMARQRQAEKERDRLNRGRSITDNENENLLHERILNIKNRNLIDDSGSRKKNSKSRNKNNKKKLHSIENITQKTYVMNNQLSVLHPKTIVEVHGISNE